MTARRARPGCRSNCKAWYSYTVGNWRIITLNTECTTNNNNCAAGSEQDLWLQSELASANAAGQCKLVTSHHPKWSSSSFAATDIDQLVTDMYAGHTDIYLTGHMHGYERFAPQNPAGQLDTANGYATARRFTLEAQAARLLSQVSTRLQVALKQPATVPAA